MSVIFPVKLNVLIIFRNGVTGNGLQTEDSETLENSEAVSCDVLVPMTYLHTF